MLEGCYVHTNYEPLRTNTEYPGNCPIDAEMREQLTVPTNTLDEQFVGRKKLSWIMTGRRRLMIGISLIFLISLRR